MAIKRMDHAGYVVTDLAAAIEFFVELGMEVEGETTVEGTWVDQLVGLSDVKANLAFLRTPDGHSRLELSTFLSPESTAKPTAATVNTPGIPRLTFLVDSLDDTYSRLQRHGATLVGEIAQYEDIYRYCYLRGPAEVIIGIVEELR